MNIVEVRGLEKSYKELKAIKGIDFDVREGEILGLLGPNGSGKSTTIGCLLALLKYDKGDIQIFGEAMTPEAYEIKSKIGIVFQDVAVFDELKVRENIDYFCGLYVKDKAKRKELVDKAIALTGLQDFEKFVPKKLSGGLLRRLNIACGIAHQPELIILDEPTVAVDPQSRNNILDGIRKLNEEGATVIYTSHYMEEVEELCDRIIILDKGEIIAIGTKEELKHSIAMKERVTVEGINPTAELLEKIKALPGLLEVREQGEALHLTFGIKTTQTVGKTSGVADEAEVATKTAGSEDVADGTAKTAGVPGMVDKVAADRVAINEPAAEGATDANNNSQEEKGGSADIGALITLIKKEGLTYERLFSELPTLNDVFLELTGTELRD